MDLSDVSSDELLQRVKDLVARMDVLATEFGPKLTQYGHLRTEAEVLATELVKRGVVNREDV